MNGVRVSGCYMGMKYTFVWSSSCKQGIKAGVTTSVILLTHCWDLCEVLSRAICQS